MLCKKEDCQSCPLYLSSLRQCVMVGINLNMATLGQRLAEKNKIATEQNELLKQIIEKKKPKKKKDEEQPPTANI